MRGLIGAVIIGLGAAGADAAAAGTPPSVLGLVIGQKGTYPECTYFKGSMESQMKGISDHPACYQFPYNSIQFTIHSAAGQPSDWPSYVGALTADGSLVEVSGTLAADGTIGEINIPTSGMDSQRRVLADLKAKFGTPTRLQTPALQNRMGAQFVGVRATWVRSDYVVTFDSTQESLDWGVIEITTKTFLADKEKAKPKEHL